MSPKDQLKAIKHIQAGTEGQVKALLETAYKTAKEAKDPKKAARWAKLAKLASQELKRRKARKGTQEFSRDKVKHQ